MDGTTGGWGGRGCRELASSLVVMVVVVDEVLGKVEVAGLSRVEVVYVNDCLGRYQMARRCSACRGGRRALCGHEAASGTRSRDGLIR